MNSPAAWRRVEEWPVETLANAGLCVRIGSFTVRLRLRVPEALAAFRFLYADFPATDAVIPVDFSLDVTASAVWRRYFRRDAICRADIPNPSAPLPAMQAPLVMEMGLNLQSAWASTRFLSLHGGVVALEDAGILFTESSGGGKSTLSAGLSCLGWRFLSDEFCLVRPSDGRIVPNPRPAALKAGSIEALRDVGGAARLLDPLEGTFKGRISWLRPDAESVAAMTAPVSPRLIILPEYLPGAETRFEPAGRNEVFMLLAEGSANYQTLGEEGFDLLSRLVGGASAYRMVYSDLWDASRQLRSRLESVA